jgi:hypothetical protein
MKKVFLVTIETLNVLKEWDYEPHTEIIIPVLANSAYNAERKIETRYWGSEYPVYQIKSIVECDRFLFKPLL